MADFLPDTAQLFIFEVGMSNTPDIMMLQAQMINLETKVSYQEHTIEELNEVVIAQHNQIQALEKAVKHFREYVNTHGEQRSSSEAEAPPPHY